MSIFSASRRPLAIVALVLAGLGLVISQQGRALADDPIFEIAEAPELTWGFKQSWRNYAMLPQASDGAATGGAEIYNIQWAFESGSYDAETGTTRIDYQGTVHWQKYRASDLDWPKPPGYKGPEADPYLLDVTLSDPQIVISHDSSVLTALASSRNKQTWEVTDYGRVPIVNLDVFDVTPTVSGGVSQWSDIVATVSEAGNPVFDNTYRVGQVVDEVGFSYTGPGGAPDFSEHWDEPGSVALKQLQNELFVDGDVVVNLESPPWLDRENLIVHSAYPVKVGSVNSRRLEAFSLEQMQTVGDPWVVPNAQFPQPGRIVAYDTNQNRLLYRGAGETGIARWLKFNLETKQYEADVFSDPQLSDTSFIGEATQKLAWDPTRDRGYRVERVVPAGVEADDYDNHEWQLVTYEEGEDGIWVKKSFAIPGFGPGQNEFGYIQETQFDVSRYATASDGSLIVLATTRTSSDPSNPVPETIPSAYRFAIDDVSESVDVQPLPLQMANDGSTGMFQAVQTSANGHILLLDLEQAGVAVHCQIGDEDEVHCDDPVSVSDNVELPAYEESRFAIDPADGTVWFGGKGSQKLAGFRDGEFVGGQVFTERHPRGGPVLVGDDHTVYAQTNDGSPSEFNGSKTWGYGKFERLGFAPTIGTQPQPKSVVLATDQFSAEVAFSSAATGDPAPTQRWQVKAPGSSTFADIAGETGGTLTVSAERGMDGTEYRAVYENAAGRVASDAVALGVDYAPLLVVDAANASVREGSAAEFSVLSDGNPEPAIVWQRRVGGFWQSIDPSDDNFVIGVASLTVIETNTEQSGALFRAKLSNPAGTVYSRAAKLTVSPKTTIPAEGLDLEDVSLDWTGNAEMQRTPPFGGSNYFSAGVSDGEEATYSASAGNARIYQVSAGGAESLASWATRAAHVSSGGEQLVRLYEGEARVEPDGSATVEWDGAFTVNFYGGLAPFAFVDPELTIGGDGSGALTADLAGCASSKANPNECVPFAPEADVTVATFSGVEIDPAGEVTIAPDYAGVEVEVPVGATPQDRTAAGWGAWPQSFVDFHLKTGLSSYWYTSASGFDPDKPPSPFVVDFDGDPLPTDPLPNAPGKSPQSPPSQPSTSTDPASITVFEKAPVNGRRVAKVAMLSCPQGDSCQLVVPRHTAMLIAGKRYWAKVIAPESIAAGRSVVVKVKLSRAALAALGRRTTTLKLRMVIRSAGQVEKMLARVEIAAAG